MNCFLPLARSFHTGEMLRRYATIRGDLLENVIHILLSVPFAQAQPQRAMGDLMGAADGQQHMAGVQRTGGAGAAGGRTDHGHVLAAVAGGILQIKAARAAG